MFGNSRTFLMRLGIIVGLLAVIGGSYWWQLSQEVAALAAEPSLEPLPGGSFVIAGGGTPAEAYRAFLQLAGGERAKIVVIPAYLITPEEAAELASKWQQRGARNVEILSAKERNECAQPRFVEPLQKATGVWLTGGDQLFLSEVYAGTAVETELTALLERNGVIGGTSAGASILSHTMIGQDRYDEHVFRGLGLLPDVIVDQHFLQRNRVQRLADVLAQHATNVGVGIDENTAMIVARKKNDWRVIGDSYAMICLPTDKGSLRMEVLKAGENVPLDLLRHRPGSEVIRRLHAKLPLN